mgnify:FL=1|jgi:hypothetical protein
MNIFKKVLCVVLCIIMMQSFAISGFAAEASVPAEDPDADSFFAFDSGVARMDSDGSFTFSFNSSLTSAHFKAKKAKITVDVTAWLRDIDKTPTWTDPRNPTTDARKTFSVTLCAMEGDDIGSFTVSANDTKTSHTFSNLTVGAEYYLEFESETTLGARIRFDGKGKVSNVTVI